MTTFLIAIRFGLAQSPGFSRPPLTASDNFSGLHVESAPVTVAPVSALSKRQWTIYGFHILLVVLVV